MGRKEGGKEGGKRESVSLAAAASSKDHLNEPKTAVGLLCFFSLGLALLRRCEEGRTEGGGRGTRERGKEGKRERGKEGKRERGSSCLPVRARRGCCCWLHTASCGEG